MIKIFNETGTSHKQKFVQADNPGQNICKEVKESNITGQEQKTLITAFA